MNLPTIDNTPTPKVRLLRYEEPASAYPTGLNIKDAGEEYRGFQIIREEKDYLMYRIFLKDGSQPPVSLRGAFTTKPRGKLTIDDFWHQEEKDLKRLKHA